jgi:hypothetical protein
MRLEAPANFKIKVGQTEYFVKDGILRKHWPLSWGKLSA